jgi:hypothetical protein
MSRAVDLVWFTRLGFAARGLLFIVIAWLVIGTGRAADLDGALEYLSTGRGRTLLFGVAAGFVAYGLWRLVDAALDNEGRGGDGKGIVGRAAAASSGVIYLILAYKAWLLLLGYGPDSGGGAQEQARTVLTLPGGNLLLGIGAAVLLTAGIWQLIKAAKCSFLNHLAVSVREQEWVRWLGRLGYSARGVIFLVTAFFLAEAALNGSSAEAGGMEEALRWLRNPMDKIVAAGLALFGIFSLIEARYRGIKTVPIDEIARRATTLT